LLAKRICEFGAYKSQKAFMREWGRD
jgi:hypothetical protein